jgi:hypothetical protein
MQWQEIPARASEGREDLVRLVLLNLASWDLRGPGAMSPSGSTCSAMFLSSSTSELHQPP